MSNFTPPNYETHPDGSRIEDENGRVNCDCGRMVWPFVLIKVTQFDAVPHDWACDGCWTDWRRHRKPLYKNEKTVKLGEGEKMRDRVLRKEWDEKWLKGHGAPDKIIKAMKRTNRRA